MNCCQAPVCLVLLFVWYTGCAREDRSVDAGGLAQRGAGAPAIQTKAVRSLLNSDEREQEVLAWRKRRDGGNRPTLEPNIFPRAIKAAARGRFAQIWWSVEYAHGLEVAPRIEIGPGSSQCKVDLSGAPSADAERDWTEFETKIDRLPPGRYRIVAPRGEVTLEVPETFDPGWRPWPPDTPAFSCSLAWW